MNSKYVSLFKLNYDKLNSKHLIPNRYSNLLKYSVKKSYFFSQQHHTSKISSESHNYSPHYAFSHCHTL